MARHKELCDGVADVTDKTFTPYHVSNNPLIFVDCAVKRPETNPTRTKGTTVPDNEPLL